MPAERYACVNISLPTCSILVWQIFLDVGELKNNISLLVSVVMSDPQPKSQSLTGEYRKIYMHKIPQPFPYLHILFVGEFSAHPVINRSLLS